MLEVVIVFKFCFIRIIIQKIYKLIFRKITTIRVKQISINCVGIINENEKNKSWQRYDERI